MREQDQQSRVFHELCTLILGILRSPPSSSPIPFSTSPPSNSMAPSRQISPAGFASLLLGISLALMLCGTVTFVIGFILMPWVLGLVMVFNLVGIVSTLSGLGRAILCPPSRKKMPGTISFSTQSLLGF
ncbi:hypothetical protein BVC80_9101g94 [Macleaya cordata]|uniref:Uncharacterized protein n=1 Tax=Macleaya cordata TaxID=56857 RepID=A0A200QGG2_MACCD|nr:hypothetical protein BVC80_9101g94 [Macleaya cordata]